MKNEEILRKAIEKAVKNGFSWQQIWSGIPINDLHWEILGGDENIVFRCKNKLSDEKNDCWKMDYATLLFSHDFAKAFWGEDEYESNFSDILKPDFDGKLEEKIKRGWHYHLQQLVLQENPLEYIKKFL